MIYFVYGDSSKDIEVQIIKDKIKNENPGIKVLAFDGVLGEEQQFFSKINGNSLFAINEYYHFKRTEELKDFNTFIKSLSKFDIKNKIILIDFLESKKKITPKRLEILKEFANVIQAKGKTEEKIQKYIEQELLISSKDSYKLQKMLGIDFFKVKNEVSKIKMFLNGEKLNFSLIDDLISKEENFAVYELTEKMFANNKCEVIKYGRDKNAHMMIFYSIIKELMIRYKLKLLVESNNLPSVNNYNSFKNLILPEIENKLKMHPFALFKKYETINKMSKEKFKGNLKNAFECEYSIRTGKISDYNMAIEIFLHKF